MNEESVRDLLVTIRETCKSYGSTYPRIGAGAVVTPNAVLALVAIAEAALKVVDLYPTIAGTSILIKNANSHVQRNQWDEIADSVWELSRALEMA